ncbi:flippase-like domain-containing protein [Bacteroidales bacterium OttesenSCG-928-L19]|nr:flippase-like domain-containing protein [Bacteroidales bacterium OttesenSCG-928-L19]
MGNKSSAENRTKKITKQVLQLLLFLGIGIFFVWLSVKDLTSEDWEMIRESASSVNNPRSWTFLMLSLIAGALAHFFRALRSILLLEPLGYKVRTSMSFYAVMVCYLANLAFPRLGEVLRPTFLQRYERVPFQKSLGTIVTERALDMIIWVVLMLVIILLNSTILSDLIVDKENGLSLGMWFQEKGNDMLTNHFLYIIVAVVIILAIVIWMTRKKWGKIPFFVKIKHFFIDMWHGLISIKDLKNPLLFIFYTLMIWVAYFLGTYLCFFAFDFLSDLGLLAAFTVLVVGSIGFMIAQGGLGAYPWIVANVLVLYKIDLGAGLAAGWIGWTVQTAMILIFGFASLILASLTSRKEKRNLSVNSEQ